MSAALERRCFSEPGFFQELEEKNFGSDPADASLMLTHEEMDYIAAAEPLTVAVTRDMAPLEYFDTESNSFAGLTIDLYNRVSEMTGLQFDYVQRGNAQTLIAQMVNGEVNLVGALAQDSRVEENLNLKQTLSFSESSFTLVAKEVEELTADSVVAVPAGYPMFVKTAQENGHNNVKEYPSMEDCIEAVYRNEADLTYIITMCDGFLLSHVRYSELSSIVVQGAEYFICFGVTQSDPLLLSIINKTISAIPKREINQMIVHNTATAKPPMTVEDYLSENELLLSVTGAVILGLLFFVFVRSQKVRQQEELNRELQQHHSLLEKLYNTLPCGIFQYEYLAPHTVLNYNSASARTYGYDDDFPVVGQPPDFLVKAGTEVDFQRQFERCEEANDAITYIWPITRKDGTLAYTECVLDIVETDQGKVFQEAFIDVTERVQKEQEMELRYSQELTRSDRREEGMLNFACFDVTEQVLIDTDLKLPGIHIGMSVDEFVDGLIMEMKPLQTPEFLHNFKSSFSADSLQVDYQNGHLERHIDLRRYKDDRIQWIRSEIVLRNNPSTGHLMCFDYIWDITDKNVMDEIVKRMAFTDCDCYMSVYTPTGGCLQYNVGASGDLIRSDTIYGENDVVHQLLEQMAETDAKKFAEMKNLSAVTAKLSSDPFYQIYATITDEKGARRDKSISFFYTDQTVGIMAVIVTDVTDVRASEVRHARLLSSALEAAEKADNAKSQFLSRVSHEMRTPLNAIIGFIGLAKGADPEVAANYLASSDIAAKQLLNVINDVLDMSSIESGNMKIAKSSFNFRHLIASLTNIYGTQCKQKGVLFETRITTPVDDWLVGDEMRVNQILMNLVGNAIKFTSEGHIWLTISETAVENEKIFIRFIIEDTGCGMTAQMMGRLFKPFEQESATTARKYGGNGLGLSIVKSLVTLMDGNIRVESKPGVGSTFIVDLPFMRNDLNENSLVVDKAESLRVLVVDDVKNEREYMGLVLDRIGVRYQCVGGGDDALTALQQAEDDHDPYNVCLIDWRMPDMNGSETTQRIRQRYGNDVIVIVVSAYDFNQAGESAREAGANLFLSKPIFQSSLFDLFMTMTGGKISKPNEKTTNWDFAGKRILLAEDNLFNQIVAKAILSSYNLLVDLAEDGRQVADMFAVSPAGYYSAILMDIQMPIMDGYEATQVIRNSNHPEARIIPIIAQTADAFNEDIAKALSAGLDDHVSKPIEADGLARALNKAFTMRRKA